MSLARLGPLGLSPSLFPVKSLPRITLLALGSALALLALPAASAAGTETLQTLADQAKALPVTTSIAKGEPGPEFGGPYVLSVKNTSGAALQLKAVIAQSVVSHNRPKTVELPAKTLEAGATWKIADLAVDDRVTLGAEGHEKLEVKVTAAK
jgi:hypothetical protein